MNESVDSPRNASNWIDVARDGFYANDVMAPNPILSSEFSWGDVPYQHNVGNIP